MNIFEQMKDRGHEGIFFHRDKETGLRAIIAVHSTVLGPGFGGARRWHYATESDAIYDVLRLSEGMTYKAAVADIPMGGGKAVVLLPKPGYAVTEAEARALGRFVESLGGQYVSAEDVGLSQQYVDWMAEETRYVSGTATCGGDPSPFTAQGVVNAMKAALTHTGRAADFNGVHVAIQGAGNVGTNVARILHGLGATLTIADINEGRVKNVVDTYGATSVTVDRILTTECDILCPCALGSVLDANVISRLRTGILCGGANNILADYDEDGVALQARDITYVPDFVANGGGVIELAGMYVGLTQRERQERLDAIENTSLEILRDAANHPSSYAAAVALAKRRIADVAGVKITAG